MNLSPPEKRESPRTSKIFPMIEPVIDALTTPISPLDRATRAMISSAAFPKVALSSAPTPCPMFADRCSVAFPIHPASGIMPKQEVTKRAVSLEIRGSCEGYEKAKSDEEFEEIDHMTGITKKECNDRGGSVNAEGVCEIKVQSGSKAWLWSITGIMILMLVTLFIFQRKYTPHQKTGFLWFIYLLPVV